MIEKQLAPLKHLLISGTKRLIDDEEINEKVGRVLSTANLTIVGNALKSLDDCTSALKTLLEAAEPVDNTTSGKEINPADQIGQLIELKKRIANITV